MRRLRFLVDVDEVLIDFQSPVLAVMEKVTGVRREPSSFEAWDIFAVLSDEECKEVFDVIRQPGFCLSLDPIPGAVEGIRQIREFCDVYAVTSPFSSPTWVYERTQSLQRYFGFETHQVVNASSKQVAYGDALLDDKPFHVETWGKEHPGGLAMLWDIPNTRKMGLDDKRVRSWDEVAERLRAHASKDTVYDLLKQREWVYDENEVRGVRSIYCMECGAEHGSRTPPNKLKHKPGCRLEEVLRGTPGI